MSHMDVRGSTSVLSNGSQTVDAISGLDPCLLLESDSNGDASQICWSTYSLDIGMTADPTSFSIMDDLNSLHVVPTEIQLGPDVHLAGSMSPSSWDQFSSSISRTPSPTLADPWMSAPLSPQTSPEISCSSPRYVANESLKRNGQFSHYDYDISFDRQGAIIPDELTGSVTSVVDEASKLIRAYPVRRSNTDGEAGARDHQLYKSATPQSDGLYHCPWEGDASCNHKPEKLKCNYDKFVDSHLKPYRCRQDSCENARFSSTACLLRHEREAHGLHGHGEKPFLCRYQGCDRALPGNGFPRQWNLRDHMKRVHNDQGSNDGSPPAVTVQPSTKGRKRKTDVPEQQATGMRKTSLKSMAPTGSDHVSSKPLLQQWLDHRHAVEDILRGLDQPEEPRTLQRINEVQRRLNAMAKMTSDLNNTTKTESTTAASRAPFVTTG